MSADRGFTAPEPKDTFAEVLARLPLDRLLETAWTASPAGVEGALATSPLERGLPDFAACSLRLRESAWRSWLERRVG